MAMTHDEWKHRMANYGYIEDARQHNTEKRLLEAIGRQRGWIKTPVPKPDWFTRHTALARQLAAGHPVKNLRGQVLLTFGDLENAVFHDREWLPVAMRYASRKEHEQAAAWLTNSLIGCAMKLIADYRPVLDPDWKDEDDGNPADDKFFKYVSQREEVA